MGQSNTTNEAPTLAAIRRILIWTLALGAAGMMAELMLIGHDESTLQFIPLALLSAGMATAILVGLVPTVATLRLLQALMVAFLASGALGVGLHFQGNEEFELEMYPSISGFELISKTMTGATPVLAPGSMSLLGIVGLVFTYRHPRLQSRSRTTGEVQS